MADHVPVGAPKEADKRVGFGGADDDDDDARSQEEVDVDIQSFRSFGRRASFRRRVKGIHFALPTDIDGKALVFKPCPPVSKGNNESGFI